MNTIPDTVTGQSLSAAWLNTVETLTPLPGRTGYHVVTRVTRPQEEDLAVRAAADDLSAALRYPSVHTVANTIFPEQLARRCRDEVELGDRYRAMYPTIQGLAKGNRNGTYFGRLVAYPNGTPEGFDQLADLIRKLAVEQAAPGPKGARYELEITAPGTALSNDDTKPDAELDTGGEGTGDVHPGNDSSKSGVHLTGEREGGRSVYDAERCTDLAAPVYLPGRDTSAMGFPCLSFCSFQLDHGRLHMVAHYRRQHLIERGYGNYLGLSRLLCYVSEQVGLEPGQLMVVAGVAKVEAAAFRIARLSQRCRDETGSAELADAGVVDRQGR